MSHIKIVGKDNTNHLSEAKIHNGAVKTGFDTTDTGFVSLETKINQINTHLDTFSGHGNNVVGEGATKLQVLSYAHDTANGYFRPLKTDTSGRLECSVDALEVTAETINLSTDTLETLITSTNTKLDTIESSANSLISANHTDLIALEASLTSMEGKQDTQVTHLSEIEGAIETIEACVGSNKVNVNISSGGTDVSGLSTHVKQDTIIGHLDGVEGKLDTIETSADALIVANHTDLVALEASLTSMEGKQDTQVTHLSEIEGAIETIEACVSSNKVNVNIASGTATDVSALSTHAKQDTIIGHLDGVEGKLDTLETTNNACEVLLGTIDADTNDIKVAVQAIDNAVDGNYLNVNQNIAGTDVDGNSGNKGAQTQRVVIATDDIPIALVNTKLGHLSVNLDTLESSLASMEGKQDTQVTHLSEIEGAIEVIETVVKAEDSAHSSTDAGIMALAVHQTTGTSLGANGDYTPLSVNANQHLRTTNELIVTAFTIPSSGVVGNSASATSSSLKIEDKTDKISIVIRSTTTTDNWSIQLTGSVDDSAYWTISSSWYSSTNFTDSDKVRQIQVPIVFKYIKVFISNSGSSATFVAHLLN